MKEFIIKDKTIEEYQSKYHRYISKLLRYSEKDIKDFNKSCPGIDQDFLLRKSKWWLIDGTYYEAPNNRLDLLFIRYKRLGEKAKASIISLLTIAVASAVTFPLLYVNGVFEHKGVSSNTWNDIFNGIIDYTKTRNVTLNGNVVFDYKTVESNESYKFNDVFTLKIENDKEYLLGNIRFASYDPSIYQIYNKVSDGLVNMRYKYEGSEWSSWTTEGAYMADNLVFELRECVDNYSLFTFKMNHYELKIDTESSKDVTIKVYFANNQLTKITSSYSSESTTTSCLVTRNIDFTDYGKTEVKIPD